MRSQIMPINEAFRILELYPNSTFRDKLTILMRLIFCVQPIMSVLEAYLPRRGLIVDLGCGYGIISHLVLASCPDRKVIGIDMALRRIDSAKRSAVNKGDLSFHLADARNFQIPLCDGIILIDILSYFSFLDQERILIQCYKNLESGGVMVIKDNCRSPKWKYKYARLEERIKGKLGMYGREVRQGAQFYWESERFMKLLVGIGFRASMIPLESWLPYPGVFYICYKQV